MIRLHKLDTHDEWVNSAYDEDGYYICCDLCGEHLKWNPDAHEWYCPECGREFDDREDYFDYIGAEPPSDCCIHDCKENYPFCKRSCTRCTIDPNDPMLD